MQDLILKFPILNSACANGGARSCVCAHLPLRSAPHQNSSFIPKSYHDWNIKLNVNFQHPKFTVSMCNSVECM